MIQVCSQCGTRWNVRDRQRVWCPRCNGALMAPSAAPASRWSPAGGPPPHSSTPPRPARPGAPHFRWIAVRPGPPPPPRRRRRPLGPTPRYLSIPRWGFVDPIAPPVAPETREHSGPAPVTVRAALLSAVVIFGLAAFVHVVRYVLLLINRTTLLPPVIALGALWLGVLVSLAAIIAVGYTAVVMTSWLIARREAVFRHRGQDDPRPVWALRAGSLVPILNLVWAPVFVLELADAEDSRHRLRGPVAAWWIAWVIATAAAVFATATSFTTEPQGIADNTVATIIAYLLGAGVLVLLWQVFDGFVRKPVERPLHRWVVVTGEPPETNETAESVEPDTREPAA